MPLTPPFTTPADLAAHFGVPERTVREKAQALGCISKIGAKVVMFEHHVDAFLEAMECRSSSIDEAGSGTSRERLPEGDFAALRERLTAKPQNGSKRKKKQEHGNVISMARGQG